LSTNLPADIEATISNLVKSGRYSDPIDALREAVRLLEEREQQRDAHIAKLQVGIDQADRGELIDWTPELRGEIRRSARRRARAGDKPNPDVCP
jgi:putative addiction module CopG family antidote